MDAGKRVYFKGGGEGKFLKEGLFNLEGAGECKITVESIEVENNSRYKGPGTETSLSYFENIR